MRRADMTMTDWVREALAAADIRKPSAPPDDDRTPMTRTELAMLWDLLRTWHAGHPNLAGDGPVALICGAIDAELAERFGG